MPAPEKNDPLVALGSADTAANEAAMGALVGALKWGAISAVAVAAASVASPVVRGLTIQFRVYLWMCPTSIGSMVEADRRLVRYEQRVRAQRREIVQMAKEAEWEREMREVEEMERRLRAKGNEGSS